MSEYTPTTGESEDTLTILAKTVSDTEEQALEVYRWLSEHEIELKVMFGFDREKVFRWIEWLESQGGNNE